MAVPITGWTFQDIAMEVLGSYTVGMTSQQMFSNANSNYFNPTYNVLVGGQQNLAQFRDYGSHNGISFTVNVSVSWTDYGGQGYIYFNYYITNVSSTTKTFYVKGNAGGVDSSIASHTLNAGTGNGGTVSIFLTSKPLDWFFYLREGDNAFTYENIVEFGTLP